MYTHDAHMASLHRHEAVIITRERIVAAQKLYVVRHKRCRAYTRALYMPYRNEVVAVCIIIFCVLVRFHEIKQNVKPNNFAGTSHPLLTSGSTSGVE